MTTANQHTSGPWKLEQGNEGAFEIYVEPKPGEFWLICKRAAWQPRVEMSEANARLLASAPDLLEALEKTFDLFDACFDDIRKGGSISSDHAHEYRVARQTAKDIIAKATGK